MRTSLLLSGLCLAASAVAQAVSEGIAPSATAPAGCKPTFTGNFTINVVYISLGAQKASSPILSSSVTVTLKDGILHDSLGRTGDIVANRQFQFDGPPQAGSIYTGGFSACSNGSLALGGSTIFYACASGAFSNLYDENIGAQCSPVNIIIVPIAQAASVTSTATVISSSSASGSASKSASVSGSASASASTFIPVLTNSTMITAVSSISILSTQGLHASTATGATGATGTAGTAGTTASASGATAKSATATASTGAAVATLAAARDILGAAVGAFGAAVLLF